jgi:hypothetical protein
MVAIMLALALTLATIGMTTLTQHALAYGDNSGSYNGYAYQPSYAQDCTRWDSNCWNNVYNQPSTYHNVDYGSGGGIWVTPSGFSCWGEWRCDSGWNHAIVDASNDFAAGYTYARSDCPDSDSHTQAYCTGYTQGYVYMWNLDVNARSSGSPLPQSNTIIQQCINSNFGAEQTTNP